DCGADPRPSFDDLGDAIRRCRIDFGAEIKLDISPLLAPRDKNDNASSEARHFVVGTITYAFAHAEALGWPDLSLEARTGVFVLIKPTVLGDESADVRQYRLENPVFPQQTTADQWYGETQFESYRRLGETCAERVFKQTEVANEALRPDLYAKDRNGAFGQQMIKNIFEGLIMREWGRQSRKDDSKP